MTTATVPPADDYTPLVAAAVGTAAWLLMVKVGVTLVAAAAFGARTEVALFGGFFPLLRVLGQPVAFTATVTAATLATAAAAGLAMVRPTLGADWPAQVVRGRAVGVLLAFETLLFEVARHRLAGPVVRYEWVWAAALLLIGAVAIAAYAVARADRREPGRNA